MNAESNAHHGAMLSPSASEIECRSGLFVNVADPDPGTILLEDIAHHLALTNRYGGATRVPYSVASHSLLVCDLVEDSGWSELVQREALMHDAAEAYLGDLCSPVKWALRRGEFDYPGAVHRASRLGDFRGAWAHLEADVESAIRTALMPPDPRPEGMEGIVRRADLWALRIEAERLTASGGAEWRWPGTLPNDGRLPVGVEFRRDDWLSARTRFLTRARSLGVELGSVRLQGDAA